MRINFDLKYISIAQKKFLRIIGFNIQNIFLAIVVIDISYVRSAECVYDLVVLPRTVYHICVRLGNTYTSDYYTKRRHL